MKELECARILRECSSLSDCKADDCPYAKYGELCRRVLILDSADCIEKLTKSNISMSGSINNMAKEISKLQAENDSLKRYDHFDSRI